jgi:hypothetical protein
MKSYILGIIVATTSVFSGVSLVCVVRLFDVEIYVFDSNSLSA